MSRKKRRQRGTDSRPTDSVQADRPGVPSGTGPHDQALLPLAAADGAAPPGSGPESATPDVAPPVQADAGPCDASSPATTPAVGEQGAAASAESAPPVAPVIAAGVDTAPIGSRLRAAREARGLSREALADAARIPLSAIGHIENNRIAALGATIYARGFLRSYARAVGVPEVVVDSALRAMPTEEPPLVVANPAGFGDRLAARYKNPLIYALLTLVVVVPLVFLATPQTPRAPGAAFAPLDDPSATAKPSVDQPVVSNGTPPADAIEPKPPGSALAASPAPVMASMAPMAAPAPAARPPAARVLALRVSEASWVELTASDGRRLEYAQLPAGTIREYVVDGGADLVVGNVPGVAATLNGRPIDLNAVANRNVARLRVGDATPEPRP
jgi:cytoskeleton protein RodZ